MIEIYNDTSIVIREARQHNPVLASAVSRERASRTFWRWLEAGKLWAAVSMLRHRASIKS